MAKRHQGLSRREFVKIGVGGLTALAVHNTTGIPAVLRRADAQAATTINLRITEALVEMESLDQVYMWTFADTGGPRFPGPVLTAVAGETVTLQITNQLDEVHAFAIHGTSIRSRVILPGETRRLTFVAPRPGTYLYLDPLNAPVNRVLGLHGVLVVLPAQRRYPYDVSDLSAAPRLRRLFDDFGVAPAFPGTRWRSERTRIWHFHATDPVFNAMAQAGEAIDPFVMRLSFKPRYFTIGGKGGFSVSHDRAISLEGHVGEPMLVRVVNTGLATHAPHIHANHAYLLAKNGRLQDNVFFLDTFTLRPLDRQDWLVPFIRPPDIAGNPATPLRVLLAEELATDLPATGGRVRRVRNLEYPMHCHTEMSQTLKGGNYPLGAVVHIAFTGDLDGPFEA